jgi:hypothetical protein
MIYFTREHIYRAEIVVLPQKAACHNSLFQAQKIQKGAKYPNLPPEKENRNCGDSCNKQEHSPGRN